MDLVIVGMLRLRVLRGNFDFVMDERLRSSPCAPTMLVDAWKRYSQFLKLNYLGPFPNTWFGHFFTIVKERWKECGDVRCLQDILLGCGWSDSVWVFKWVNVCRLGLPRSIILFYLLRWSCVNWSVVFAFASTLLRDDFSRWWIWLGGGNSNNNERGNPVEDGVGPPP